MSSTTTQYPDSGLSKLLRLRANCSLLLRPSENPNLWKIRKLFFLVGTCEEFIQIHLVCIHCKIKAMLMLLLFSHKNSNRELVPRICNLLQKNLMRIPLNSILMLFYKLPTGTFSYLSYNLFLCWGFTISQLPFQFILRMTPLRELPGNLFGSKKACLGLGYIFLPLVPFL